MARHLSCREPRETRQIPAIEAVFKASLKEGKRMKSVPREYNQKLRLLSLVKIIFVTLNEIEI